MHAERAARAYNWGPCPTTAGPGTEALHGQRGFALPRLKMKVH